MGVVGHSRGIVAQPGGLTLGFALHLVFAMFYLFVQKPPVDGFAANLSQLWKSSTPVPHSVRSGAGFM